MPLLEEWACKWLARVLVLTPAPSSKRNPRLVKRLRLWWSSDGVKERKGNVGFVVSASNFFFCPAAYVSEGDGGGKIWKENGSLQFYNECTEKVQRIHYFHMIITCIFITICISFSLPPLSLFIFVIIIIIISVVVTQVVWIAVGIALLLLKIGVEDAFFFLSKQA